MGNNNSISWQTGNDWEKIFFSIFKSDLKKFYKLFLLKHGTKEIFQTNSPQNQANIQAFTHLEMYHPFRYI